MVMTSRARTKRVPIMAVIIITALSPRLDSWYMAKISSSWCFSFHFTNISRMYQDTAVPTMAIIQAILQIHVSASVGNSKF